MPRKRLPAPCCGRNTRLESTPTATPNAGPARCCPSAAGGAPTGDCSSNTMDVKGSNSTPYKTRIKDYLEGYIDTVRTREVCAALLQPGTTPVDHHGYRVISPVPAPKNPDPAIKKMVCQSGPIP